MASAYDLLPAIKAKLKDAITPTKIIITINRAIKIKILILIYQMEIKAIKIKRLILIKKALIKIKIQISIKTISKITTIGIKILSK